MYQTREDSFFMSEVLLDYFKSLKLPRKKVLDLGTGSVIQAETLTNFFDRKNIIHKKGYLHVEIRISNDSKKFEKDRRR